MSRSLSELRIVFTALSLSIFLKATSMHRRNRRIAGELAFIRRLMKDAFKERELIECLIRSIQDTMKFAESSY